MTTTEMSFPCPMVVDQKADKPSARQTVAKVIAEHRLHPDDFFGRFRDKHLVAARRDATRRLDDLGFSCAQIAITLKRNHSTILNYLPKTQARKEIRYAGQRIVSRLAPELAALVVAFAKAEDVSIEDLIVRWIADRAEGEAHAKARQSA